jgi:hypothetical protein
VCASDVLVLQTPYEVALFRRPAKLDVPGSIRPGSARGARGPGRASGGKGGGAGRQSHVNSVFAVKCQATAQAAPTK